MEREGSGVGGMFARFVKDEEGSFRSSRLKIVPRWVEASWMVKSMVGNSPILIGKQMPLKCFKGEEYLEVDMLEVELGGIVHLSDITLPEGAIATALELGDDHDLAIASVIAPRGMKDGDEDEAGDDADGGSESSDGESAAGDAGEGNED